MKFLKMGALVFVISAAIVGCTTTTETGGELESIGQGGGLPDASSQGIAGGPTISGTEIQGIGDQSELNAVYQNALDDPNSQLSKRVIYFTLDSSVIQEEYRPVIAAHAEYLSTHPELNITLEGHADERGSREYNIALGEQRAISVARTVKLQGVEDNQIEIVSYGEEKPVVYGNDESSWSANRRVEIVYSGR